MTEFKLLLNYGYSTFTIPYIHEYSTPSNNPSTLILGQEILENNKNGFD